MSHSNVYSISLEYIYYIIRLGWVKLTCLTELTQAKVMVKLAIPVIRAMLLQDVASCHHHWQPKARFDLFHPNLAFVFFTVLITRGFFHLDQTIHLLGQRANPTLYFIIILGSVGSGIRPADIISFIAEVVNSLLLGIGYLLLIRRGDITHNPVQIHKSIFMALMAY